MSPVFITDNSFHMKFKDTFPLLTQIRLFDQQLSGAFESCSNAGNGEIAEFLSLQKQLLSVLTF